MVSDTGTDVFLGLKVKTILCLFIFVAVPSCNCQYDFGQGNYIQMFNQVASLTNNARNTSSYADLSLFLQRNMETISALAGDVLSKGLEAISPNGTSKRCLKHTELFLEALVQRENWALRMVDAMGKPASGLMDYHMQWVGDFDECVAIQATEYEDPVVKSEATVPYTGKYCTATFPFTTASTSLVPQLALSIALCVPDTCSPTDTAGLLNAVTGILPFNITLPTASVACQEKSLQFTDKATIVTIVGAIFVAIIVIATALDVFFQHGLSKQTNKPSSHKTLEGTDNVSFEHPTSVAMSNGTRDVPHDNDTSEMKRMAPHKLTNGTRDVPHDNDTSEMKSMAPHKLTDIEKATVCLQTIPPATPMPVYVPGTTAKLLLSFSVYSNAPKILSTRQPAGTLSCINGIRFLSMTWVILGHALGAIKTSVENKATFVPKLLKRFTFQAVFNATVSVDTFFVLSGLLVSYLSLREMKKRGGALKFNWILYYFHRYWRLTPPYMLLLMLYVPTIKYWADGPFWSQTGIDNDECRGTWWTNLLYINNLYKSDNMCMGWSWYLANDMQFYVISPIMLIPLYYSPIWGSISCLALIVGNVICGGVISNHYGLNANIMFNTDIREGMQQIYFKPWTRIGPYVVGVFTGYILYRTECKVKMSKLLNCICWTIAAAVAMAILYGLYTPDGSPPDLAVGVSALYNATSRTAWGVCVSWVIFACATGYGGPINALLSWGSIIPLSRLTYCAYLVHPLVMTVYVSSRRTLMYWDDLEMIYLFLGHLCVSYAAAFVISLAFESPMMGLEKVLLGRKKNS